jgi:hypothetical protein
MVALFPSMLHALLALKKLKTHLNALRTGFLKN